ncbi:hypothetical protein Tco_1563688 [Tanacetum coccineum]
MTNGSRLNDGHVCREMIDEFAPPKFFASIRGMEHDQLFTKFNVGATRQMSLSAKVGLLKVREGEIENLKAQSLRDEVNALKERNSILEKERNSLDVKVIELEASAVGKERELTVLGIIHS